eukprot:TRINITY_DN2221_c0_g1_i1.p1 TRINITY_DN2221_c0_g1~~TRINITY_DN2221_c0_g1_i1.p1  ORF type:complete len:171 (-),score=32.72 TRINITY_DN2221_c0_g1_i1:76-588(-)
MSLFPPIRGKVMWTGYIKNTVTGHRVYIDSTGYLQHSPITSENPGTKFYLFIQDREKKSINPYDHNYFLIVAEGTYRGYYVVHSGHKIWVANDTLLWVAKSNMFEFAAYPNTQDEPENYISIGGTQSTYQYEGLNFITAAKNILDDNVNSSANNINSNNNSNVNIAKQRL